MPKTIINNTTIYFEVQGNGPPLVMIQGYLGDHSAWSFQVRAFRRYFRVITYDARGIGQSDVSKVPYTIPVQAGDVMGLMDFLKIDRAHIIGISLGGLVAQAFAILYPERIMKLVLAATFPGIDPGYLGENLRGFATNQTTTNIDLSLNVLAPLAFNNPATRLIIKLIAHTSRTSRLSPYVKQMQSIGNYSALEQLDRIQAPTLVIAGSRDKVILPHSSEILAGKIPGAKLVMVKGGSHAFFMENRREFNREVLQFLRSPQGLVNDVNMQ
jgi:3-oxoadipate enol-lactonase